MTDLHRPAWAQALSRGLLALFATLVLEAVAGLAWIQGAGEAGLDRPIASSLALFPGSAVRYQVAGDAHWIGWTPGWLCLVAGLLTFLLVAGTSTRVIPGAGPARDRAR